MSLHRRHASKSAAVNMQDAIQTTTADKTRARETTMPNWWPNLSSSAPCCITWAQSPAVHNNKLWQRHVQPLNTIRTVLGTHISHPQTTCYMAHILLTNISQTPATLRGVYVPLSMVHKSTNHTLPAAPFSYLTYPPFPRFHPSQIPLHSLLLPLPPILTLSLPFCFPLLHPYLKEMLQFRTMHCIPSVMHGLFTHVKICPLHYILLTLCASSIDAPLQHCWFHAALTS